MLPTIEPTDLQADNEALSSGLSEIIDNNDP
jgi:hypothetical protein